MVHLQHHAAHQEKLRIADELCKDVAKKVAEAEVEARDYAKGLKSVAALKKEMEAYQVPDPTVDEIERLEGLALELDSVVGRHQQLLFSGEGYKVALEESLKAESELPGLKADVDLYDDMVKALAPGRHPLSGDR